MCQWPNVALFRADEFREGDATNNFALGHCAINKEIADVRLDCIRKLDTKCTGCRCCLIYHAIVATGRGNHYLWITGRQLRRDGKGTGVAWA